MSRLIDADALYELLYGGYDLDFDELPETKAALLDMINGQPTIEPEQRWIPVTERMPEEAYPVIVTWKNDDPEWYYQHISGKHYTGVAHYKNGKWYWYSSITEDVLMEYGRYESEEFDEAIKVLAWMPLPEPYRSNT